MKKIMNKLFLSCLKATELIEKKIHIRLSLKERIQLRFHKMMCDACTLYEKQSNTLEKVISGSTLTHEDTIDLTDLKKSINSKINKSN